MALSGGLAFITTRLIIEHFGIAAYAQYGLLSSLASLVPFADLGMSAAVMNAMSEAAAPRTDDIVRRTLISALRVLVVSAAVLLGVAVVLTGLNVWPGLLGSGLLEGGGAAALLCVAIFAVSLPLGIGQRILTGLGKNHVQIAVQALAAPFILVSVLTLIAVGARTGNFLPALSYLAGAFVATVSTFVAARLIKPQLKIALRAAPKIRTVPGVKVMSVAWPMLAQMLALPIAMQTDRLLLSHLSDTAHLAQYNLAAQLFGFIIQSIAAAGLALWPIYAKARTGRVVRSPIGMAAGFLAGGLLIASGLAVVLPSITPVLSDGKISLSPWLVWSFVAFAGAQAAKYPLGMYMTDLPGLRFQVLPIMILVPLNLGISWALIAPLGAAGPVLGSALSVVFCQVLPNFWYVKRDLVRRREEVDTPAINTPNRPPGTGGSR